MSETLETQIACVRRELKMRKLSYPLWVMNGRMQQKTADHELSAMQSVLETLLKIDNQTDGLGI